MSQNTNQVTQSKIAHVAGMAETFVELGAMKFASVQDYEDAVYGVASRLTYDPADPKCNVKIATVQSKKYAGQIFDALTKLSQQSMKVAEEKTEEDEKEEIDKARKEVMEDMDEEEKKEASAYFQLLDQAAKGGQKIAMTMAGGADAGKKPGQDADGNSERDASEHDALADIDLKNRPEGFAENVPTSEPSANIGEQSRHPNADAGALKTAEAILAEMKRSADTTAGGADAGKKPGQDADGNSEGDAAAHDALAQIDLKNRPDGYAEGVPTSEPSANIGEQSRHPNADAGALKTAEAVREHAEAKMRKIAEFATRFDKFQSLDKENKIAHMKAMASNLDTEVQYVDYLTRL